MDTAARSLFGVEDHVSVSEERVQMDVVGDDPLHEYVLAKQSVAQLLREGRRLLERSAPWAAQRIHDLMTRLGDDRFELVVVGQFKRGKTSLMNAIIRRPLLPTGTIPVTSAVTSLRYGSTTRAFVRRAGRAFNEEIPIAALPAFITERGNPGNMKRVLSMTIEVQAPFLRRGLRFVDTPGIGSAHEHNTAATLEYLPEADAAIFVTGADGPLSQVEMEFLDAVRQHVRKLFFVLNKIDQLGPDERDEVVTYTTRLLAARLGVESTRVFPVSAARALAAGDADLDALDASGLPAFESTLATFLNEERRAVFLVALLDRAVRALDETRFMLDLRQHAEQQAPDTAQKTLSQLNSRLDELEAERRALIDRMVKQIADWQASVLDPALERFGAEVLQAISAELPSAVFQRSRDSRRCYADTCDWLREQLEARCGLWISGDISERIDTMSRSMVADIRRDISTVVGKAARLAASLLGVGDRSPRSDGDDPDAEWNWVAPAFELSESGRAVRLHHLAGDASRLPLPRGVAARSATRKLAARLPHDVERAKAGIRELVLGYLHACVVGADVSSTGHLAETRRRLERAIEPSHDMSGGDGASVPDVASQVANLSARMSAARDALLRHEPLPSAADEIDHVAAVVPSTDAQTTLPFDTAHRPVVGTCAICSVVSDGIFNFLCHHQYAIARDVSAQRQFVAARGLCPTHTWHLERVSSPRGLCESYPALLDQMAQRMREMTGPSRAGAIRRFDQLVPAAQSCPACVAHRKAEHAAAEQLVGALRTPDGFAAFERSQWLCLMHLKLVLEAVEEKIGAKLLRLHARRLLEISESMREYAIKHDAGRQSLLSDEEMRAYREALILMVGEKYLFRTEPEE